MTFAVEANVPAAAPGEAAAHVTPAIEVRNVSKSYGRQRVLRNVNLQVRDREFIVFVGPSGCGKSTLLRVIAGLEDHEEGRVLLGGQDITDHEPADRLRAEHDALEVQRDEPIHLFLVDVERGPAHLHARVVHEHVDSTVPVDGLGNDAVDRRAIGHV